MLGRWRTALMAPLPWLPDFGAALLNGRYTFLSKNYWWWSPITISLFWAILIVLGMVARRIIRQPISNSV